jgi:transcriptional regulator with XRE-family HTH domain
MDKIEIDQWIDEINKQIGKNLLNFRIEIGFSRQILAPKMGITHQQLKKYEDATNQISIARLFLLAKMCGRDITYFLSGIHDTPREEQINEVERIDLEIIKGLKKIKDKNSKYVINSLVKNLIDRE